VILLLKNVVFTLLVPATVAVYIPWLIVRSQPLASLASLFVASILFAVGATIYLWCVWDFATFGRGTPAPVDPPKRLVVRGLYRYSRNPMYVGALTVILGWVVLFPTLTLLLYGLCVAIAFHLFIVFYEEPHLRKVFGAEYEEYCSRVGRWLARLSKAHRM